MLTRREFVAAAAGTVALSSLPLYASPTPRRGKLRVGVIGCGGRGTGAATDTLNASPDTQIVALADVMAERVSGARETLAKQENIGARAQVAEDRCYAGWDAYKKLLASDVDMVILATPPHFRPIHFEAAIAAGKHVFMEKPVAVDGPGVRKVIAAAKAADDAKLCVVSGTQRRHQTVYLEAMERLRKGEIGKVVSARCYWLQGGLWMNPRQSEWSDMEWQLRNWLYFTWLSGDHICEQHVHNLDVMNWGMGATPLKAQGLGGRQVRTGPEYGHVFDHFSIEYEYPGGVTVESKCRQIDGCVSRVEEIFVGSEGTLSVSPSGARIEGGKPWKFAGENPNPYVLEHVDLVRAILSGEHVNEGKRIAESTLTAIMGRMAAYTGKTVTWEQALNSQEDLAPPAYEWGSLPVAPVAVPGKTKLV